MTDITVWVNGREKRVTGVSRSTTCRDVVTLLLRDHLKKEAVLPSYSQCFSLFEQWGSCERVLSPRTRLYKLWKAWGHEQKNVRFTLRRSTSSERQAEEIGDELVGQGVRKHRRKGPILTEEGETKTTKSATVRHLKVTDESKPECGRTERNSVDPPQSNSGNDLDKLVKTVVDQSKRLQELLEKNREIDMEIEFYETRAHLLRVEANGKNYVQEAYLSRLSGSSQLEETSGSLGKLWTDGSSDLETYFSLYEHLLNVETQLAAKRGTIAELTETIMRKHTASCRDNYGVKSAQCPTLEDDKNGTDQQREIGLVRAQLAWSTDVSTAQKTEIATVQNQLASAETLYTDKCYWLDILLAELERLEVESSLGNHRSATEEPNTAQTETESKTENDKCEHIESKLDDGHDSGISMGADDTTASPSQIAETDSSSDTGVGSLHSQEEPEFVLVPVVTLTETLV